jgi:hypothetical protein
MRLVLLVASVQAVLVTLLWLARDGGVAMTLFAPWIWWRQWWFALALAVVFIGISVAATRGEARRARLVAAAVVLLAVQGVFYTIYPRQQQWDIWRHPEPYVQVIKARAHGGRAFAVGALPANTSSAFEIPAVDSLMTFNPERAFELYRRYAAPDATLFLRNASLLPPDGVLDAWAVNQVAVRNAFAPMTAAALDRGLPVVYDDLYVTIFARANEPRCYFTTAYQVHDRASALEAVAAPRPTGAIVLEEQPFFASDPGGRIQAVKFVEWGRNRITVEADTNRPGFVYCADNFASGWRATVNGADARILVANYAFRAVMVQPGVSAVTFSYWPPRLNAGIAVSGGTTAAWLAVALVGRRRRARHHAGARSEATT